MEVVVRLHARWRRNCLSHTDSRINLTEHCPSLISQRTRYLMSVFKRSPQNRAAAFKPTSPEPIHPLFSTSWLPPEHTPVTDVHSVSDALTVVLVILLCQTTVTPSILHSRIKFLSLDILPPHTQDCDYQFRSTVYLSESVYLRDWGREISEV